MMTLEHKALESTVSIGDHETVFTYQLNSFESLLPESGSVTTFSTLVSLPFFAVVSITCIHVLCSTVVDCHEGLVGLYLFVLCDHLPSFVFLNLQILAHLLQSRQ